MISWSMKTSPQSYPQWGHSLRRPCFAYGVFSLESIEFSVSDAGTTGGVLIDEVAVEER